METLQNEISNKPITTKRRISRALAGRLSRYREIVAAARKEDKTFISSETCGRLLHVDGTLVRKDMAGLGVVGKPHVGYALDDIQKALDRHVREQTQRAAVLVGAGNLGTALVRSGVLEHHGVHLERVFDIADDKVGQQLGRHHVMHMDELEAQVIETGARLAVVTVDSESAQRVIDRLAQAGIRVIWNFAPIRPVVPSGVKVLSEHLTESVSKLARYLEDVEYELAS